MDWDNKYKSNFVFLSTWLYIIIWFQTEKCRYRNWIHDGLVEFWWRFLKYSVQILFVATILVLGPFFRIFASWRICGSLISLFFLKKVILGTGVALLADSLETIEFWTQKSYISWRLVVLLFRFLGILGINNLRIFKLYSL